MLKRKTVNSIMNKYITNKSDNNFTFELTPYLGWNKDYTRLEYEDGAFTVYLRMQKNDYDISTMVSFDASCMKENLSNENLNTLYDRLLFCCENGYDNDSSYKPTKVTA